MFRIAVILVVAGLSMSVPPAFGRTASDHFGLLLHPLFPHVHAVDHNDADSISIVSDGSAPEHLSLDEQPGLRGQPLETGFRSVVAGMLLPLALAAGLLEARRLRHTLLAVPHQHWRRPPAPPPRFLAPARQLG